MTDDEWGEIVDRMIVRWPQTDWAALMDGGTIGEWYADLADLRADQVAATCEVLYREGHEWPRNGAQIRERLILLSVDAPDWAAVKAALPGGREPGARVQGDWCPDRRCDGSTWILGDDDQARPCSCRPGRVAGGRPAHPMIAAFVDEVGAGELRDVTGDRTAEAQVRGKWEAFVRRVHEVERVDGLPTAGLAALERASADRLPRQLDSGTVLQAIEGGRAA